jgi:hypothetical protein
MSDQPQETRSVLGDIFDRQRRALHGLPDVTGVKTTTVRSLSNIVECTQTFTVETMRFKDKGDYVFLEYIGAEGSTRIVLPPEVADVIARQRDALTTKNRKRAAKTEAQRRKAAGIQPGFLKIHKKKA